ncbi:AAA family ATPase [Nocardioides sp. HM23]|uniref:helix-turn-helix transcriptional regulator n=1 Tax=Nocardioides bizhenqiangii TaxID=3095076 RepID=UPI002ACA5627|nr:AAA family ATPase [Nocardioides sp. HM23]MDZ5622438.1 AAA family ATPase [Nocardioides sp. HM23]
MLIGRTAEWADIEGLLGNARNSSGGVLLLRGEAGVGKTALLERAAAEPGWRALRATGVEGEADLAYATAHQLLHPLLPRLDDLPGGQADAVRTALGMAAGGTPDRFLVALGFLTLVSEAAREEPLLLVLDDVQWCDAASLDAFLFVGRRLAAEPVALLLALRDEPGAEPSAPSMLTGLPGVRELRLGGLSEPEVGALMAQLAGALPVPTVSHVLAESTHGNPLALVELVRFLTPDQIAGRQPLPETLPVGQRIERSFLVRSADLSSSAHELLLVAAAEPAGSLDLVAAAAGVGNLVATIEEIERAGLARYRGDRLEFSHPLARSAIYGEASTTLRRKAHQSLASELTSRGDVDRSVWHRAAATLGADDLVATALVEVGDRARERSAHAAAAAAYERAAGLSTSAAESTDRLLAAADAAWQAGQSDRAGLLLDRAEQAASESATRSRMLMLRARMASRAGDVDEAHRLFLAAAELQRDDRPADAIEALAEAAEAAGYTGDVLRLAEIAEAFAGLPSGTTPRERFLLTFLEAGTSILRPGLGPAGESEAVRLREELAVGEHLDDPRLTVWAGIGALNLGDVTGMQRCYRLALDQARNRGAAGALPYALEHSAMNQAFAGEYAAARAAAEEGLRLATETGQQRSASQLLAVLAFVAGTTGDEATCLRLAEEARQIAVPRSLGLPCATATWALARLELVLGRFDQAVDRLVDLATARPGIGHPAITLWSGPDLVEAATRARRPDDAREAADRVGELARIGGQPGASAIAAWCRGLLGGPDTTSELAAAADAFRELRLPLAEARARLSLGELLRRDRQPRAAREHLRVALEGFSALDLQVWADRAAAELRASGEAALAPESNGLQSLTPQELQIARYVAQGASNRDVAAKLFISPRTVEYHLYKVYPKLGITSRTQLITTFADVLAPDGA